jgi:hypothetical protein
MEYVTKASAGRAVRFYESDRSLARMVAEFLQDGIAEASPGIAIATANQRELIIQELTARRVDVAELRRSGDLLLLDADEMLSALMHDGAPDPRKFRVHLGQVIDRACRGRTDCTVRIFAQIADVLWQRGERDAAVRLEVLWNRLAQAETVPLLCGYAIGNFFKTASFASPRRHHAAMAWPDGHTTGPIAAAYDTNRRGKEQD